MPRSRTHLVFIFACTTALTILLGSAVHAVSPYFLPWENEHSVRAALSQQTGRTVVCEAGIAAIAARNNPPYFVLGDGFRANNEPESRIVVLCRPPLNLTGTVRVTGTLGRLPNNEPCITDPIVEGLFDQRGRPVYRFPFLRCMDTDTWQVLPIPTGPIPSPDESLPDGGVPGEVSAYSTQEAARFDTVASLLATSPPVLSLVELSAKPIVSVNSEEGYIVVGDDNSYSTVKIYTLADVKPGSRLVKAKAVVHSENGRLVLYSGYGDPRFFDPQGPDAVASVSVASPGTVAYAATLSDANADGEQSGGFGIMSASSPTTSDGSWVYLTGQIVNYVGSYYSYAVSPPGWVNVYYIQGLDRTSGIRVWKANSSVYAGNVVDVMARCDTKDGQRILGIVDTTSPYDYSSVECKVLSTNTSNRTVPVGMKDNRELGGTTIGNNPGVTDGYGLYNIGSYVTVWGRVLEKGTYQFAQSSYGNTKPYMRIDDGSGVPSGNCNPSYGGPYGSDGVTIFGTNSYNSSTQVAVGDYVSVTGVSSVWKPSGSDDTYRSIWTSDYARNLTGALVTRQVVNTGAITGTVKLYDMPNEEAVVQVFCTSGHSTILTVTRGADGSGSATYNFTNIPKTVLVGSLYNNLTYAVSAKSDGFKTRTYTNIIPGTGAGTTRNIYIVPLRKIYVTASTFSLSACSGQPSMITATVRDSDHNPVEGTTVRFKTDRGSFVSGSVVRTISMLTLANGTAIAALYPVLGAGEYGYATVQVTDDSAPLAGDSENDDPYKFDWESVLNGSYGIYISSPSVDINPYSAVPTTIDLCGDLTSTITATVKGCGSGLDGVPVTFSTNLGCFSDRSVSKLITSQSGGIASVVLKGNGTTGTATVTISAQPYGMSVSKTVTVNIGKDTVALTPNLTVGQVGQSVEVTANVKDAQGNNVVGRRVYFSQTGGDMTDPVSGYADTDASGNARATITRSTVGKVTLATYEDTSCGTRITQTINVWFFDPAPDDWPMFMHDPQHTGMSPTWDTATETLTRQWVVDIPTASTVRTIGTWSITIDQQTIYHRNPAGAYSFIFEHPYIDSSPVVVGNKVVVGTWTRGTTYLNGTGSVKAFLGTTGDTLWTATGTPAMGGVASTPCISDGRVYVGTSNGYLYCLDLSTGNQIWARQTTDRSSPEASSKILSSPVVHNGIVYITNEASKVYAFTADDNGTTISGYPIILPVETHGVTDVNQQNITGASSPAITSIGNETYLLVGCDDGYVYRIKLSDLTVSSINVGGCVESSPAVSGNNAYVGVSIYAGKNVRRLSIEPLAEIASWKLGGGEESRATVSLEYDFAYNGVDTGHQFFKMDANATGYHTDWLAYFSLMDINYFVGSAGHTTNGLVYTGNDNGRFYVLNANDLTAVVPGGYYDGTLGSGFICSSPAIAYNVDDNHNRWVFITTRAGGGKLFAFKTNR